MKAAPVLLPLVSKTKEIARKTPVIGKIGVPKMLEKTDEVLEPYMTHFKYDEPLGRALSSKGIDTDELGAITSAIHGDNSSLVDTYINRTMRGKDYYSGRGGTEPSKAFQEAVEFVPRKD